MVPRRRFSRRYAALIATAVLFFLYHIFSLHSSLKSPSTSSSSSSSSSNPGTANPNYAGEPAPFCPPLPGIEDVLVVMKTGVTESREKVPIHFKTTLRCIPHFVIYPDFEEEIEGVKIHDVLRGMDPEVKERVEDFNIYNRIVKYGRKGLEQDDFADEANSAIGKPNNPGWKLDKWKFLPMIDEALKEASRGGHVDVVQELLSGHIAEEALNSALLVASENGHESTVRPLLAAGANRDVHETGPWRM